MIVFILKEALLLPQVSHLIPHTNNWSREHVTTVVSAVVLLQLHDVAIVVNFEVNLPRAHGVSGGEFQIRESP